jgi:mannose-1-phosphate guanylyltransferase/mannose-6-phosphate isomerase
VSTHARPKPFHRLAGRDSLLQATVLRLGGAGFSAPIIVCAEDHAPLVERQLKAIGAAPALIVTETTPRGTAVAATLGCLAAACLSPGGRVLIAPADHAVMHPSGLRRIVLAAAEGLAEAGDPIALFGAPVERPETGYGYIHAERSAGLSPLRTVEAFVEKPDARSAAAMAEAGGWLWNTGLFLARGERLLAEVERHAPLVHGAARQAWDAALASAKGRRQIAAITLAPHQPTSLDRAVIEHARPLVVAECRVGWRDVGCWQSIWGAGTRDGADNQLKGAATVVDSSGCLVWSSGPPVAVIGLNDIVVVTTPQGVLVMPRSRAQEVSGLTTPTAARTLA